MTATFMAKGKRSRFTGRGRGSSGKKMKGRAMNAQSPLGLVQKDALFRAEGNVSDLVHEPGAPSSDEEGEEEEQESSRSNGVPLSSFSLPAPPCLHSTGPDADVTITVPVAMWVSCCLAPLALVVPFDGMVHRILAIATRVGAPGRGSLVST
jgi:hypothetical protein